MKNIIEEKPNTKLVGRLKKTFQFVSKKDIENKVILDIGCGYGWFEFNSFKLGAKKIYGVEISDDDLSTIKQYLKNKNFIPMVGNASHVSLKSKTVHTVVSWEVIEHIPSKTENDFFQEVSRILKKNGTFYLSTPHKAPFSTYLDPAFWLIGHRHYSEKQLRKYGEDNGFSVEDISIVGGIWTSLSIINMYISKWIFRRGKFMDSFFITKENEEYQRNGFYNIFVKYRKK